MLVCASTGCTYLIPPDQSVPRYNEVIGDLHRPQLNGSGAPPAPTSEPQSNADSKSMAPGSAPDSRTADANVPSSTAPAPKPAAEVSTAIVTPVTVSAIAPPVPTGAPTLPPVSPEVQALADKQAPIDNPSASFAAINTPPAANIIAAARVVPVENEAFVVSDNAAISTVPPRPPLVGETSTAARLAATRSELQQNQAESDGAKAKLAHDAAAEPSLLNPGVIAPLPPIPSNLTPPPPMPAPQPQSAVTPQSPITNAYAPITTAPPAPAPVPVYPVPATAQLAPIRLIPPTGNAMTAPLPSSNFTRTAAPSYDSQTPVVTSSSGFNPYAEMAPASAYGSASDAAANGGFLPQSRYSARN